MVWLPERAASTKMPLFLSHVQTTWLVNVCIFLWLCQRKLIYISCICDISYSFIPIDGSASACKIGTADIFFHFSFKMVHRIKGERIKLPPKFLKHPFLGILSKNTSALDPQVLKHGTDMCGAPCRTMNPCSHGLRRIHSLG